MPNYRASLYSVKLVRDGSIDYTLPPFTDKLGSPAKAASVFAAYLAESDREEFVVALLSNKGAVIGLHTAHKGTLVASLVGPREVFKFALLGNAARIMVAHNHPSGDPGPSQEDKLITERLFQAGKLLDIALVDHIIIGFGPDGKFRYYSFSEQGFLSN